MSALDVFAAAIETLKELCIKSCNETYGITNLGVRDILWVLTVPAIWEDDAKMFMRKAAFKVRL